MLKTTHYSNLELSPGLYALRLRNASDLPILLSLLTLNGLSKEVNLIDLRHALISL